MPITATVLNLFEMEMPIKSAAFFPLQFPNRDLFTSLRQKRKQPFVVQTGQKMTMSSNKRKGDDVFANDGPSRVVVGNSLKDQLQVLRRANNEEEDPILSAMKAIDQNDGDAENSMMKESEQIKSKLQREIQQALFWTPSSIFQFSFFFYISSILRLS